MKNEKCVICNLNKSEITYMFWGKNYKGYTNHYGVCGYYKINDVLKKYDLPVVKNKNDLKKAYLAHEDNIIIPVKNIYDLLGLPKEVFLKREF